MQISYTYKIDSVDEAARCMVVEYSSASHQTMMISTRLPFADEELEAVIGMYAPVAYWVEQTRALAVPTVGATGTIVPVVADEPVVGDTPQIVVNSVVL
jgi:hypothetical protein